MVTRGCGKDYSSKNGCSECLENYIGNDIMSRLNEDGDCRRCAELVRNADGLNRPVKDSLTTGGNNGMDS